jgi:Mn2+/Fe2+ NRAMP family transporter
MIPDVPLLSILYVSQVINGILLPIVLIFMLVIVNDKRVMGDHVNSKIYNYITWTTVVIMIGLSVGLIVTMFL